MVYHGNEVSSESSGTGISIRRLAGLLGWAGGTDTGISIWWWWERSPWRIFSPVSN